MRTEPNDMNEVVKEMRAFSTGATRNTDEGKLDFEGFFSPSVMVRFSEYMHKNRVQADGVLRPSDNWQKGMPPDEYMKSMFRHFMTVWAKHRKGEDNIEDMCALMFNVQGYLYERLENAYEGTIPTLIKTSTVSETSTQNPSLQADISCPRFH